MSHTRSAYDAPDGGTQPLLRLSSPADILAAIPYLLGFHPTDSIVVMGIGGPRQRVRFTSRADLPGATDGDAGDLAGHIADLVAAQLVEQAIVVAYGDEPAARCTVDRVSDALERCDIEIRELLRAYSGRYWSYDCSNSACCPPEGTAYDIGSSAVAAAATVAGCVALPDRDALKRSLAPIEGITSASMLQATARAEARLETWAAECSGVAEVRQRMLDEGRAGVCTALERVGDGGTLTDDETASLALMLTDLQVRDEAWLLIDDDSRRTHIALWTYVARRATDPYVAAPASLLAFAAWQDGNGALASVAVDRALQAEPEYSMAHLLGEILDRGVPPECWEPPVTPGELRDPYPPSGADEGSPTR